MSLLPSLLPASTVLTQQSDSLKSSVRNSIPGLMCRGLLLGLSIVAMSAQAWANSPVKELRVYPEEVQLKTAADRQLVVVQVVRQDGITQDVSREAKWSLANPEFCKIEKETLFPTADGKTELKIEFEGHTKVVPVEVSQATQPRPISFKLDVMPVFMKAGCNSGSCHGAARGKDGFRLSLFGYDPDGDFHRIYREQPGRRVDTAIPEESLLIEKSVGAVPHSGGKRFEMDSELNKTMIDWVAAGCPRDPEDVAVCTSISLYPPNGVLDGAGTTQQVTVRAKYSDGTDRDITALTLFMSNNDNSATISQDGVITAGARGEAFVMARFATFTVGSHFVVLPKAYQYSPKPMATANYVDELVNDKLMKLRIEPSQRADDESFVRRIYLDLVGTLPTEEEYTAFMASTEPNKRDVLIDQLIERKEFTELWVSKWAEWLMMRSSNDTSYKSIVLYYNWLSEQISQNVPLNIMVRDILSANGGTFKNAPTNFYQIERNTLKVSENVAQIFMGMRTQCAQCHNHPFDRWTQDDYYAFASFFSQIGRKEAEDYRETIVFNSGGGDVRHPITNKVMEPIFLGGPKADTNGKDRREVLANWLASPENPYFAENFVNRIWHHFFNIGIVDPIDDVRISNPASNEPLLKELAKRFTESNYNFKQLIKEIVRSEAYQRSTQRNESNATDEKNFAHQSLRRIKAETMLDVITQVTSGRDKFRGLPLGSRAVQIADGQTTNYFLTTFGRATRETACSCEVKMEPTLSQALHLLNGDSTNQKINQGNLIGKLQKENVPTEEIVSRLYIRSLSRKPTDAEMELIRPVLAESKDQKRDLEDIFWALLNSREFLFNH